MSHKYDLTITQASVPKHIQLISDCPMEQDEVLDLVLQACFSDINGDYKGLEIWGDHLALGHPQPTDVWGFDGVNFAYSDYRFTVAD